MAAPRQQRVAQEEAPFSDAVCRARDAALSFPHETRRIEFEEAMASLEAHLTAFVARHHLDPSLCPPPPPPPLVPPLDGECTDMELRSARLSVRSAFASAADLELLARSVLSGEAATVSARRRTLACVAVRAVRAWVGEARRRTAVLWVREARPADEARYYAIATPKRRIGEPRDLWPPFHTTARERQPGDAPPKWFTPRALIAWLTPVRFTPPRSELESFEHVSMLLFGTAELMELCAARRTADDALKMQVYLKTIVLFRARLDTYECTAQDVCLSRLCPLASEDDRLRERFRRRVYSGPSHQAPRRFLRDSVEDVLHAYAKQPGTLARDLTHAQAMLLADIEPVQYTLHCASESPLAVQTYLRFREALAALVTLTLQFKIYTADFWGHVYKSLLDHKNFDAASVVRSVLPKLTPAVPTDAAQLWNPSALPPFEAYVARVGAAVAAIRDQYRADGTIAASALEIGSVVKFAADVTVKSEATVEVLLLAAMPVLVEALRLEKGGAP